MIISKKMIAHDKASDIDHVDMTLCELVGRVSELGLCGAVSSRGAVSVLVHVMLLLLLLLLLLDMVAREAGKCSTTTACTTTTSNTKSTSTIK